MKLISNSLFHLFTIVFLLSSNLEAAVSPPQKLNPTNNDKIEAEQLQQNAKAYLQIHNAPFPQSIVHLAKDSYVNEIRTTGNTQFVDKAFGLEKHKALIEAVLNREAALKNYYVVYTAVPTFHMFQDITRKMYEATQGRKGNLQKNAFQFLRYEFKSPIYDKINNTAEFIADQINKYGIINDRQQEVKSLLISGNLSLFGNLGFTGESTWYFFNEPQPWSLDQSWKNSKKNMLIASLKSYGYSDAFVDELLNVEKLLEDAQGYLPSDLMQIFIPAPKDQLSPTVAEAMFVNKIGYSAWRMGIPFDLVNIQKLFEKFGIAKKWPQNKSMTFGVKDGMPFSYDIKQGPNPGTTYVEPTIDDFIRQFNQSNNDATNLSKQFSDKAKNNNYSLSWILRTYKNDPDKLLHMNWLQARILITNGILLNPESGVLIYRYDSIDPTIKKNYEQALDTVFVNMEKDRTSSKVQLPSNLVDALVLLTDKLMKLKDEL